MSKHLIKFKKMMALTVLSLISSSSYAYNYFPDDFSSSLTTGQINHLSFNGLYGATLHNSLKEDNLNSTTNVTNWKESLPAQYFSVVSNPTEGNIHYFTLDSDDTGKLINNITVRDFNTGKFHPTIISLSLPNITPEITLEVYKSGETHITNYTNIKHNLNSLANYFYSIDDNSLILNNEKLYTHLNIIEKKDYVKNISIEKNFFTDDKINQISIVVLAIITGLGLGLSSNNTASKKYYKLVS